MSTVTVFPILGTQLPLVKMGQIDTSESKLSGFLTFEEMDRALEAYVSSFLLENKLEVGYGGYHEKRGLYLTSPHFNRAKTRNIHLGVDVWTKAGTPIYAPFDGTLHSHHYNEGLSDYGHCLIVKCLDYHILFGHLSPSYLTLLKGAVKIKKGQLIAHVGDKLTNGGWVPHLHLQIINNIGNYQGDYPGVCAEDDLDFYRSNCPDPTFLIGIK